MKNLLFSLSLLLLSFGASAQLSPAITSWLQNTTETGSYYIEGNSTPIGTGVLVNTQLVEYSDDFVYIHATGIPAYPTGPFLDGNPSNAEAQNVIFKYPLDPQPNTGAPDGTTGGNIGSFVNGVALFDFRDGTGWNPATGALCGGPGNPPCPGPPMQLQDWNRDAIPAEMEGFDCSKAHPAMGNYHHHQNPSAFKLDLVVVSNICNLYDADGLYAIDENAHSPLIGFAYDGYPIYGAYAYANADGSGGITRIKSGYSQRAITVRTHYADGTDVSDGPPVDGNYPIGYFREDYEFISNPAADYLDEHNGRFAITPEYPSGTYAYYATVDQNWNSFYPYAVGPTFYGNLENRIVTSVDEPTTIYDSNLGVTETQINTTNITVFPNPSADLIAIQLGNLNVEDLKVSLLDINGKLIMETTIKKGATIAYFDVEAVYEGAYFVCILGNKKTITKKVIVKKE
jgi:hypothetical protein